MSLLDDVKNGRWNRMPASFHRELAREYEPELPKNARMRFVIEAPFAGMLYEPDNAYSLTATEYADVCEGETQTAQSVCCESAAAVLATGVVPPQGETYAYIQDHLRERFASLAAFTAFCDEQNIAYDKQPLWVDTNSFNEYT